MEPVTRLRRHQGGPDAKILVRRATMRFANRRAGHFVCKLQLPFRSLAIGEKLGGLHRVAKSLVFQLVPQAAATGAYEKTHAPVSGLAVRSGRTVKPP